jgi:hypothetical protein
MLALAAMVGCANAPQEDDGQASASGDSADSSFKGGYHRNLPWGQMQILGSSSTHSATFSDLKGHIVLAALIESKDDSSLLTGAGGGCAFAVTFGDSVSVVDSCGTFTGIYFAQ